MPKCWDDMVQWGFVISDPFNSWWLLKLENKIEYNEIISLHFC